MKFSHLLVVEHVMRAGIRMPAASRTWPSSRSPCLIYSISYIILLYVGGLQEGDAVHRCCAVRWAFGGPVGTAFGLQFQSRMVLA